MRKKENKKPKLLFICPALGVRSEVWLYRQATGMNHFDVHVLCNQHQNQVDYPALNCAVTEMQPSTSLLSRAYRKCRRVIRKRFGLAATTRAQDFDASKWEQLTANNFDACLVQYGTMATKFTKRLIESKIPYVIHFHGFDLSQMVLDPEYVRNLTPGLQAASHLIVVANYMRDWLINHGVEASKIISIPCGVPTEQLSKIISLPYGVPTDQFVAGPKAEQECRFLMVGRLTHKKSPQATIRAFARCHQQYPETRLRIVGDGLLKKECQQLVTQLNLTSVVTFLGAQPSSTVQRELATADVFVQHSVTPESGDREGWPVAIAEAAASSLPVISTRHASIPEQVIHGETGFLVEEHDWEAMAEYMCQLAGDRENRVAMGTLAQKHISQWDSHDQIQSLQQVLLSTVHVKKQSIGNRP